ncbi:DUF445 domain-containing protein [Chryseobacterium sp. POL2]|uniref:DUF445 domain-containing protein n=1 Tax=Chryseobacterium sp. POL2 TaxID=2713414 RepID=UPI0013E132B6|nr:DUF445 domain-containing protein [Chryseobacterium sp. POL2]QIG89934.1 DUF445 domain-containing protein [Chryseobacterium sp. POL2]
MTDSEKKIQLRNYKMLATGLFILMAITFVIMTYVQKTNPTHWVGYIRAFSEAAMVGALADWFAVTALFHHPMGIKIPHTNLIERSKEKIGDNLGNFVVDNFLAPENIRPYILKLKISGFVGEWIGKEKNQNLFVNEASNMALDILLKLDDKEVVDFVSRKLQEMTGNIKVNKFLGNGLEYLIEKNDHQQLMTNLSGQIKNYILENQQMVEERVEKESYFFVPKSVDRRISEKIVSGLSHYFEEIEQDANHPLRKEITSKLLVFADEIKTEVKWENEFKTIKNEFLNADKLNEYAADIWFSIKETLKTELMEENSGLKKYILKNLNELSTNLQNDEGLQKKIDHWIRVTAYKYILKNTKEAGNLISSTVGNWEGKELSRKLELEVGKDLQFIRINGTIVGGLVGLIIYSIAQFL